MDAAHISPGTMDYLEAEAGPLLDDQDYMEQPKTPKKKKLCRKDKEGSVKPKSPVKPIKQTEANPPNQPIQPQEEEPFFDRLVQYIMANKKHITGLTMQTISTNQWVTVNIKSDPEPEPAVIQLPDFVNQ